MMPSSLINKLQEHLQTKLKYYGETNYLIAVSGGIDSLCLAFLLSKVPEITSSAIIVNHNLRPSSLNEAKQASSILDSFGVKNQIISLEEGSSIKSNIEDWARKKRYEAICNYAKKHNFKATLLAHQQDDIIENFFIRLTRGSGIDGLATIDEETVKDDIRFLRPLLSVSKAELKTILVENNISWIEDPSNQDERFLRNKIRNLVAELLPESDLKNRILQTADHCKRAKEFLASESQKTFKRIISEQDGELYVNHIDFKDLNHEIGLRVLILILNNFSQDSYKPRFKQLENIYKKIISLDFNRQITFSHCLIKQKRIAKQQFIIFSKEKLKTP